MSWKLGLLIMSFVFAGCSTVPLPIIDAHTHTYFDEKPNRLSEIPNTKDQFLKEMKENGVVGAVSHQGDRKGQDPSDLKQWNVISCAGVGERVDVQGIEKGLRSGKFNCIKIYLGYIYRYAYDKDYEPLYRLAEKYDVPVVFHTGDTSTSRGKLKYADPLTIDEVAVDHPKVRFVIAHCGNPWIESAAEVAYKNPNVYLDGSAFLLGDLRKQPDSDVEKYMIRPLSWILGYIDDPSKLMFGTDWPLVSMGSYIEAFKRAIPKEHWRAVFHDNAVRVFKFPGADQSKSGS